MSKILKPVISFLISLLMLISPAAPDFFGLPEKGTGNMIDMNKFTLTWNDEFDGDKLDSSKWGTEWWVTMRKGGYWHEDMLSVKDGHLIISTQYYDKPLENRYYEKWHDKINFDDYGPGYYSSIVTTSGKFEQCYGYFETRCILPAGYGLWSAFWMMNEGVYNVDGTGNDGTEIDVFESMYYKDHWWGPDSVAVNLHLDGYNEAHQHFNVGRFFIENNPYEEFNTYGVEWNPDEYIFYINGEEVGRTNFGGVSDNPEYLLLSVEVAGQNGVADSDRHGTGKITKTPEENWPTEFVVDYVRCYQYKDRM